MGTTQEFKVKIDELEARVTVKLSGWLRRKREVVYALSQIPKQLARRTYSMLEVAEKLKKKPFQFHIHFSHWRVSCSPWNTQLETLNQLAKSAGAKNER